MKKLLSSIIIAIIFIVILWVGVQIYTENKNKIKNANFEYNTENIGKLYNIDIGNQANAKEYPKADIIKKYKGYEVLAKLEIPKIKLETYILKECNEKSLNKAVAKFWGANPNNVGNCCIAGHNAPRNKNMFYHLKELAIGDNFTISDNNIGVVQYKIYDIYKVVPNDVSSLSQKTQGQKEVTLITCTNNSQKRLILKGRETI